MLNIKNVSLSISNEYEVHKDRIVDLTNSVMLLYSDKKTRWTVAMSSPGLLPLCRATQRVSSGHVQPSKIGLVSVKKTTVDVSGNASPLVIVYVIEL